MDYNSYANIPNLEYNKAYKSAGLRDTTHRASIPAIADEKIDASLEMGSLYPLFSPCSHSLPTCWNHASDSTSKNVFCDHRHLESGASEFIQPYSNTVPNNLSDDLVDITVNSFPPGKCIFVYDTINRLKFIVDTGASTSAIPRRVMPIDLKPSSLKLVAANNTPILTYGQQPLTIDIGLDREFTFIFTIADVNDFIIGIDFLTYFGILVDVPSRRLIEKRSILTTTEEATAINPTGQRVDLFSRKHTRDECCQFRRMPQYNDIRIVEHEMQPHIGTSNNRGPQCHCQEFQHLSSQGVLSSPVHVASKHDVGERSPISNNHFRNTGANSDEHSNKIFQDFYDFFSSTSNRDVNLQRAFLSLPVDKMNTREMAFTAFYFWSLFSHQLSEPRNSAPTFQEQVNQATSEHKSVPANFGNFPVS